ncbi:DNA -binding domain-containing protein [Hephaestia sp. GCM10023244]|uniref:DNA -binding domain-containing protein n=1 Tax=unclassified Hephaestia TaxID=2631281 RepID=UPI002076F9FB|nr:DUF2285 domain-containing protein [Hephaestia sp. MAHUQ-44]MCM8732425.1 DUF2285 domain-containing protein [Hephaestia sp. MAHUQ-44]
MPRRAAPPAARRRGGGSTFAERPEVEAPDARIIWHADLDPGALGVDADRADPDDPDGIDPARLARWLTLVTDSTGRQHAVLSDGLRHIRLDIDAGRLAPGIPVRLHYRLEGLASAVPRILTLRRFLHLCRHHRFAASLFTADRAVPRGLLVLRVRDALAAGASQRDIARALFGEARTARDWNHVSDALRSRVRRLVVESRAMMRGGYRQLLARRPRDG